MENPMFVLSAIIVVLGGVVLALGVYVFKFRAITNKKAWEGKTKPILYSGIIMTIVGIVLVYLTYPFK